MGETVRFQHYEVLRRDDGSLFELGRGAMGITYKAFDTNLRCNVALKVINSAYLNSEVARQRFLREARAAAALRHQNVATVFHLGSEDDNFFYAMEFVDGETVEAYMKREGAVPPLMAIEIADQVTKALAAAEKQGLVHRDIKPSNLMLSREDEHEFLVKVIDFGLAKSSGKDSPEDAVTLTSGGFLGTPHFASPEQLEERNIDVRSDIYSLGVTLWYMLAGKTPFSGSLAQVMSQHLHREPPFESLDGQPPEIVALLKRMMAKAPEDRPQTPSALRRELDACLVAVQSRPAPEPSRKPAAADPFETAVLPAEVGEESTTLASGQTLAGRFRLLEEIVASDYGRMFRAESLEEKKQVAILILHAEKLTSAQSFTQLEEEVERIQSLRSPSIRRIFSLERTEHQSFIALEWVEGPSLLDLLRGRRALPLPEANRLLEPLADAFDELASAHLGCPDIAAHEVVLVDGDLTRSVSDWPSPVGKFLALTQAGSASLPADATMVASSFAMMKASGAFAGNPASAYVFAVASLAFEMLGGVRGGTGTYAPIPGLSEEANTILRRGLDPAKGYASAGEFAADLSAAKVIASAPPPTRPVAVPLPVPIPQEEESVKKPLWPFVAIGMVVFLVLVGVGIWIGGRPERPAEAPPTVAQASPTPIEPSPSPVATPADPYVEGMTAANTLLEQDDFSNALLSYAVLARKYPDQKEPLAKMEMITAGIRTRSAKMSPAELAALRPALEAAADLQVVSAQMVLGESLRLTTPDEALKWFLLAGEHGQTEAMVYAGNMLANGKGVSAPDLPGAVQWFEKAANLSDKDGIYLLAECYLFGKGIPKDPKRAIELLTSASTINGGDPRAMNLLGTVYRQGVDVPADYTEAARLFTGASERGFLDAQGNLGVLYINGQGVPKDIEKAVSLFQSGADKGNPICMYFLAQCLEGGVGMPKDMADARSWYVRAAQAGNRRAMDWCLKNKVPFTNSP